MITFSLPLDMVHPLQFKFCTTRNKCYCANFIINCQRFGPNMLEIITLLIKPSPYVREI